MQALQMCMYRRSEDIDIFFILYCSDYINKFYIELGELWQYDLTR